MYFSSIRLCHYEKMYWVLKGYIEVALEWFLYCCKTRFRRCLQVSDIASVFHIWVTCGTTDLFALLRHSSWFALSLLINIGYWSSHLLFFALKVLKLASSWVHSELLSQNNSCQHQCKSLIDIVHWSTIAGCSNSDAHVTALLCQYFVTFTYCLMH